MGAICDVLIRLRWFLFCFNVARPFYYTFESSQYRGSIALYIRSTGYVKFWVNFSIKSEILSISLKWVPILMYFLVWGDFCFVLTLKDYVITLLHRPSTVGALHYTFGRSGMWKFGSIFPIICWILTFYLKWVPF